MSHAPQVVDRCHLSPGKCRQCGSQAAPIVDTMVEDIEGRLYLCGRCVSTFAPLLGWLSPDEATELRGRVDELEDQVATLEEELEEARAQTVEVVSVDALIERLRTEEPTEAVSA